MIDNHILAPVFIHLFTAIIQLICWRKTVTQRVLSIGGSMLALLVAIRLFNRVYHDGILSMSAANWESPFGIVFVADSLSTTLVLLTSIVALAVSMFSTVGISKKRMLYGYFPIFHFLILGLIGAFLTGDIFNLYVFFEVIIISSFVLMTLGGRKAQLEGGVKYMAMNILASTFFLTGIGIVYGLTGSLNMADLAIKIKAVENQTLVGITSCFFIIGFGIKSAVFPLYYWLPSSYHTPPSAVAATFGGLLTKVGIYAMLRIFSLMFVPDDFMQNLLMFMAVFTIITGSLGALIKNNIRRLFSYLIVCHIGFLVGGIAMFSKVALMGVVFYLIHDIMVKTNIFLIAGLIRQLRGTLEMSRLGGLYKDYPKISLLIAIVLFSLVGIPPLSGFWPKIFLFQEAFSYKHYAFGFALIVGSFVTLYVIARMWALVFWRNQHADEEVNTSFDTMPPYRKLLLILPILLLATVTVFLGLNAEYVVKLADRIAEQLIDPSPYIEAVLGKK